MEKLVHLRAVGKPHRKIVAAGGKRDRVHHRRAAKRLKRLDWRARRRIGAGGGAGAIPSAPGKTATLDRSTRS